MAGDFPGLQEHWGSPWWVVGQALASRAHPTTLAGSKAARRHLGIAPALGIEPLSGDRMLFHGRDQDQACGGNWDQTQPLPHHLRLRQSPSARPSPVAYRRPTALGLL